MNKTTSRFPLALTSCTIIITLYGCSATLPSHDGSLHTVYGIDSAAPEQATPLSQQEPALEAAPIETYEPMVQTISGSGVIASSPIAAIEAHDQEPEEPQLAATLEAVEEDSAGEAINAVAKDLEHKLAAGETLFSVAGDLTGSSNNWKVIADYNSISNPGAVTIGQSIVIPGDLLIRNANDEKLTNAFEAIETIKAEQEEFVGPQPNMVVSANGTQEIEFAALETTVVPTPYPMEQTRNNSVVANAGQSAEPKGSLTKSIANFASIIKTNFKLPASIATAISPPTVKGAGTTATVSAPVAANEQTLETTTIQTAMLSPEVQPKPNKADVIPAPNTVVVERQIPESEQVDAAAPVIANQDEQWIQVDGNFTPKAVYKGAGYTTGLLMRVSPGTKFKLTSKTDDWYKIETNQGAGYIFHRDVLVAQ